MTIFGVFSALLCLAFLVFWHELGHFFAARVCGVGVERFCVGFGKVFVKWRDKHQTEFCLAWIPFGGYVRMYDEHTPIKGDTSHVYVYGESFAQVSAWRKLCIVLAGPFANVLLTWMLLIPIHMLGTTELLPVLQKPQSLSAAAQAGLQANDRLIAIDGKTVTNWKDVELALIERLGHSGIITIDYVSGTQASIDIQSQRGDAIQTQFADIYQVRIPIENWLSDTLLPRPSESLGLMPWRPRIEPRIATVQAHSAAEKAGLIPGDLVLKVNNQSVPSWEVFVEQVRQHPDRDMQLFVERDGGHLDLVLRPRVQENATKSVGFAGVTVAPVIYPAHLLVEQRYGFFRSVGLSTIETVEMIRFVWVSIVKLFTGSIDIRNVSGPVGIVKIAADSAENGLRSILFFTAYISMSLALMNLLPIPILDGGQAIFIVIEKIIKRPIQYTWRIWCMRFSMAFLLLFMIAATFNDLLLW